MADLQYPEEQEVCRKFFSVRYDKLTNCVCGAHREYQRWLTKYEQYEGDFRGNLYEITLNNMPSRCRIVLLSNITNRKLLMMYQRAVGSQSESSSAAPSAREVNPEQQDAVDLFPITFILGNERYVIANAPSATNRSRMLVDQQEVDLPGCIEQLKDVQKRVAPRQVAALLQHSRQFGRAVRPSAEVSVSDARFLNRMQLYLDLEVAFRAGDFKWSPLRDFPIGIALARAYFLQRNSQDYRLENVFAMPGLLSDNVHDRMFEMKLINYRYRILLETCSGKPSYQFSDMKDLKAELQAQFCGPADKFPCFTRKRM